MDYPNDLTESLSDEEEDELKSKVFSQLKPCCLDLLQLLQSNNTTKDSSSVLVSLLRVLRYAPSSALQPFFDYTLFPLLLLLDAAVDCRSPKKDVYEEKNEGAHLLRGPPKVSDKVAEGVLQCLEELLKKCRLGSSDQMVVVMKKLAFAALLSPSQASEEFCEGVIKCLKALLLSLLPCSDEQCSCREVSGVPALLNGRDMQPLPCSPSEYDFESRECLCSFLRSQDASVAVGHWLSLLLKAADIEAARGHRGSAKLRTEAYMTLRVLVAKVGTADALAFFLPGVVSQFAKVLHVSRTMISGAGGSVEALDQAIRGLAEYLIIVLADDANISSPSNSLDMRTGFDSTQNESAHAFLDELRQISSSTEVQSGHLAEESTGEAELSVVSAPEFKMDTGYKSGNEIGSLRVDRTRDWIEKTSENVNKLLNATFPHICNHPAKKVRQGLVAAINGLLSKCSYTLKGSRLTLLECLCVLIIDDSEEVSATAQEFLQYLFSSSGKHHLHHDVANIFSRLIERLPKTVLGKDETSALSHAMKLLVVIYYSGPQLVLDQLQSPVTAARFLDVFAICMSHKSAFTGSLDKLILGQLSSVGYLQSIAELKPGSLSASDYQSITDVVPSDISKLRDIHVQGIQPPMESLQKKFELPRMPPWFAHVGSQKLYQALGGVLRLVGLSLVADIKGEGHLSVITDIPLSHLRKLVSEIRIKEYNKESWKSWYNRTGSGQLLREASTAACILNEMVFGVSSQAVDDLERKFQISRAKSLYPEPNKSVWKISEKKGINRELIDCIGRILHEYLSSEVWDLPVDHKSSLALAGGDAEEMTLHFYSDTAMLQQVIIDGIGIFSMCLGKDFVSSGFLHSSLYLLLECLICSNFQVRSASDSVLHVLAIATGYQTVGQLVLANADYIIDSICRQLRHLDLNPHAPNVLASMLAYVGVAYRILPQLEEPMRAASHELEILGRHQHPELTMPFLKAVGEICKAAKHEACSLPTKAESFATHMKSKISDIDKEIRQNSSQGSPDCDSDISMANAKSDQWESILFELNDSKRYRRTVGSIAGSCLTAAAPLLASMNQPACLVALDIVEDGLLTLAKVEEAYRHEKETKEAIEELIQTYSLYQLQDTLDVAEEGVDENRLLPAMNKVWPFLVACVRNKNPVAVRKCVTVVGKVVQICGGDFFTRRFHTDGLHFWKLLSTSPFHKKPFSKEDRNPLQLPYRSSPTALEDSMAEGSNLKVQAAVLDMIADLSRNKRSASALEVVLKKVSGLVVGIACSGVTGLHDAAVNALRGLASIDPDLIWLLLADVYYSAKKNDLPSPPNSDFPHFSHILPPPSSPKEYLYVQYGGQSYGFDIYFSAVETVFKKLNFQVFTNQMYV